MELTRRLLRWGTSRPHVLLVEAPGSAPVRRRAERELEDRGWPRAASPAAADVLVVCGRVGEDLGAQVERVWDQMPGPRARCGVLAADQVVAALDGAREELRDLAAQRADARARTAAGQRDTEPDGAAEHPDGDTGAGGGHDMDTGGAHDMDMGGGHDMDMGGGHDMDMGGGHDMDMMSMPGGLPMASTGPDRDGLELDVLRVQLGPVLPHWPPGLVAVLALQGDVVSSAELRLLDGARSTAAPPGADDLDELDRAAAVLALAGADHHALRARALRDGTARRGDSRAALARAVARDRVLRWSLSGLPSLSGDDLWSALLALLDPAARSGGEPVPLTEAQERLRGAEVTAVRLALAAAPPLVAQDREPARA